MFFSGAIYGIPRIFHNKKLRGKCNAAQHYSLNKFLEILMNEFLRKIDRNYFMSFV